MSDWDGPRHTEPAQSLAPAADGGEPEPPNKGPGKYRALAVMLIVIAGGFGGVGFYYLEDGVNDAAGEVAQGGEILSGEDPIGSTLALIEEGGRENLEIALGVLMRLSSDQDTETDIRISALILLAEMYDPATFNAERSPFPVPNADAARRMYARAADLGSDEARKRLERLGE